MPPGGFQKENRDLLGVIITLKGPPWGKESQFLGTPGHPWKSKLPQEMHQQDRGEPFLLFNKSAFQILLLSPRRSSDTGTGKMATMYKKMTLIAFIWVVKSLVMPQRSYTQEVLKLRENSQNKHKRTTAINH